MKVQTYINEGPGMFWGYKPGDRLVPGPVVTVQTPHALGETMRACEDVWFIGNRMGPDLDGNMWPATVRSLSVSDVIVIGETAYAAASFSWEPIPTEHLTWSLDPERQIRNERLEEARR